MLKEVTLREIERIFAVTDPLGISREALVIPLLPRHPGRVRKMPNGKLEIVVDSEGDFEAFVAGLEGEIRRVTG
ncbi:MAG TPA: hypothetical protein VIC87_18970 [Vicinamibacteria bacterium]|jgi:hypothetical protein